MLGPVLCFWGEGGCGEGEKIILGEDRFPLSNARDVFHLVWSILYSRLTERQYKIFVPRFHLLYKPPMNRLAQENNAAQKCKPYI